MPPADSEPSHRIRIRVSGKPDFTVVDDRGPGEYVTVREALGASSRLVPRTLSDSARVLVLPIHGRGGTAVIAVFGWAYGSDPNELTLIGFGRTGYPRLLFRRDLDLAAISDVDGDGKPEIVGRSSLSEAIGRCSATYAPYVVYRLDGDALRYDMPLSHRYNQAHYVWAGPHAREDIEVNECTPGKYRVVRHKQ